MTATDPLQPFDDCQPMKRNRIRIGVGLITSVAIFLMSDRFIPFASTELSVSLVRMSLLALASFAIGGLIAKSDFVVPAAALATFTWLAVAGYSVYLGSITVNPLWDYMFWNLLSSVLIPAAALGAKIGTIAASRVASLHIA